MRTELYQQRNANLEEINILIVEDDVFIADSLKISLEALGYGVAEPCLTVEDAIQILKTNSFDLAILDINFYGKDEGISLGKHIQEYYHFPFIFLTAFSDAHTVSKATMVGPSAYLVKPSSTATIFATIQTALHNFTNQSVATEVEENWLNDSFFVKNNGNIQRIYWKDVICIESAKNYAILSLKNAYAEKIALRGTLVHVLRLMPVIYSKYFVQINRSCYIHLSEISKIGKDTIWVGNREFAISSIYRKGLIERIPVL